jgi:glycosyltransferase involved in cell wall biosynthesis
LSEPLNVVVNDRVLFRPLTGVGHYVAQLLAALRTQGDAIDVRGFLSTWRTPPKQRAQVTSTTGRGTSWRERVRGSWQVRRVLQGIYRTAFRWRTGGFALYHEPNHIPIRCDLPTVTTVHDLSVLVHPEWHPEDRVRWYEREFDAGRRQTRRFIAVSEFTKREMIDRLGVSPGDVDVTYLATRPGLRAADEPEVRLLRAELNLPERFFLYVGTLEPRKNVSGLLEAFAGLPRELRQRHPLLLAGGFGWKMEALQRQIAAHGLKDDTRLLGYMSDDALAGLYTAATAFVWPTFYEGFGLPPLEAMACGCPVIVSNAASLPEVVGDAGMLLDPRDVPAWTAAIQRMAEDDLWREGWQRRGLAQAATFSWDRCARETIACYRAALAGVPR